MSWNTSTDLLTEIQEAHRRLVAGESDADRAHAEARLLSAGVKMLGVQLEHAKITERLKQGSNLLPAFVIEGQAVAAVKDAAE